MRKVRGNSTCIHNSQRGMVFCVLLLVFHPSMSHHVRPLVGRLTWSGYNFLKGREVTLPCSYRSTCFQMRSLLSLVHISNAEDFSNGHLPHSVTNSHPHYIPFHRHGHIYGMMPNATSSGSGICYPDAGYPADAP